MCSQHLQLKKKNTSLPHQILKNLWTRNNFVIFMRPHVTILFHGQFFDGRTNSTLCQCPSYLKLQAF